MSATYQLPLNALGIKVMAVKKGSLIFTPDGDIADADNGDVYVTVSPAGFNLTLQGARLIMQNIVDLELSHREFAIIKELVKPKKRAKVAGTGGAIQQTSEVVEAFDADTEELLGDLTLAAE